MYVHSCRSISSPTRLFMATQLPITPIDPKSPVPLYFQVESALRKLIEEGHLPAGKIIPSELDLCQRYNVSRQTMRMALSRLVADNLIARKPGRGTVVVPQTDRKRFYLDRSFTQQMADIGYAARSLVLEKEISIIDESAPEDLKDYSGASCLKLNRLRLGNDVPFGIQYTTLLTEKCQGIEGVDFKISSLYGTLATIYNMVIHEIRHTVTATMACPREAQLLEVEENIPLLVVYTTAFLDDEEPIEHTTSLYRTDQYEYSTHHRL